MGQEACPGGPQKLAGSSQSLPSLSGQGRRDALNQQCQRQQSQACSLTQAQCSGSPCVNKPASGYLAPTPRLCLC